MADLTITAANVQPSDGYSYVDGTAGETLTQGVVVYLKESDTRYWKADCTTSVATARAAGIVLTGASAGQPVKVLTGGTITIGATIGVGTIYILSTTGLIAPYTDLATGDYVTVLGVAATASQLSVRLHVSGVQKAA